MWLIYRTWFETEGCSTTVVGHLTYTESTVRVGIEIQPTDIITGQCYALSARTLKIARKLSKFAPRQMCICWNAQKIESGLTTKNFNGKF